jgi:hypothetical protein
MDVAPERRQFSEAHRKNKAIGSPFFWSLFFGEAKKSDSPGGEKDF